LPATRRQAQILVVALTASNACGQPFVETFENGLNTGGWTLSPGAGGTIIPTGGIPGAYFGGAASSFPEFRASGPSPFTGSYLAQDVVALSLDLMASSGQSASYPLTLFLVSDNGTPANLADDWGASVESDRPVPLPGQGWRRFDFMIPRVATGTPWGWTMRRVDGSPVGPGQDWSALIDHVSQVRFLFAPPGTPGSGDWTAGIDQISTGTCYPNVYPFPVQHPPILSANDFQTFMGMYAAGCNSPANCVANCDGSSIVPILNINDFQCFLNRFAAGCTR
jgi:hypothetical protein